MFQHYYKLVFNSFPEFEKENHSWFLGVYKTSVTKVKGWGVNMNGIKEDKHGTPNR